jgi:tRNA uridine 5-carboxymethylaminomethyl modification enzyme
VDEARWQAFEAKREAVALESQRLRSTWVNPRILPIEDAMRVLGKNIEREYSLHELLRRPDVTYAALMTLPGAGVAASEAVALQIEVQAKYQGYIEKQQGEIDQRAHYEEFNLPSDLDYRSVRGLSMEVQQKLNQHKPQTIGQAGRIAGITPAAVSLLLVHLKRGFKVDHLENTLDA